jgi:short-subunit dehydrogenase
MQARRRIWIIGASDGIGRALALQLGAEGAELILSARREAALRDLAVLCGGARVLPLDLAEPGALARARDLLAGGPLDMILSTAALYEPGLVEDIDPDVRDKLIAVNLTSVFHLAQAAPALLRPGGQLVLFGSVAGYLGLPAGQPYSATKAAVANLAESLRVELAPRVDVRLVSPGFVRTRLTAKNSFTMPAIISPEEAARQVLAGLRGTAFEIHFPRRFTFAMKLLRLLPYRLSLALTAKLLRRP